MKFFIICAALASAHLAAAEVAQTIHAIPAPTITNRIAALEKEYSSSLGGVKLLDNYTTHTNAALKNFGDYSMYAGLSKNVKYFNEDFLKVVTADENARAVLGNVNQKILGIGAG